MYLALDGDGPLYRQLAHALKLAIEAGRIRAGARMPSTRELAQSLKLSRNTVIAAYEQLNAEGYVRGERGAGNFVLPRAPSASRAAKPAGVLPAQSAYAANMRALRADWRPRQHDRLRFNLQYGSPMHDGRAIDAWARELAHAALRTPTAYPYVKGHLPLRAQLADYLYRRRGMVCDADDILIVNGTQQAMALSARVLVDPGDIVVMEEPGYAAARHVFAAHGAQLIAAATDGDGVLPAALPDAPTLIVVTPAHQFPSGALMSAERRQALLALARERGSWIFEDDYDSEFRFDGKPVPALKAIDSEDRVIYAGTFSKVLFPSLRLGYMVVPRALRGDFATARYLADFGSATIEQAAMARYMESGGFERQVRRAVKAARQRRAALLAGLAEHCGNAFHVDDAHAGMHMVAWLRGASWPQCHALIACAASAGLGLHPIDVHYAVRPAVPGLLLGYASLSPLEIAAATRLLGRCLAETGLLSIRPK